MCRPLPEPEGRLLPVLVPEKRFGGGLCGGGCQSVGVAR